ncbi:class I adenylate-forming enzyme family protein [Leptospira santarosai]|uniref:class I adenylate-forming enzyme family protein n=1 Tax=Leptospira santarosai TaxID=28183 RepID=UPI0002489546|nr:class I adenylate-forming enzyme family protein [Leptospira santarosai]EMM77607.1 AMP-binding enzyme [Leptospira santarosai str. 2000030832]
MWNYFSEIAKLNYSKIAISNELESMTYKELADNASHLAGLLRNSEQLVILCALPGGPSYTTLQLAAWKTKSCIFVPIPDNCTESEVKSFLHIVKPDLIFVSSSSIKNFSGVAESSKVFEFPTGKFSHFSQENEIAKVQKQSMEFPEKTRMIQFTSGSTGFPKGILLSELNLLSNLENNKKYLSQYKGLSVFCSVPQFHAMGGAVVLEHLCTGSAIHVKNRFLPGEHISTMQSYQCNALYGSPNYFKLLSKIGILKEKNLPDLKSFIIGTGFADSQIISELFSSFSKPEIILRYGLSESFGALLKYHILSEEDYKYNCIGELEVGSNIKFSNTKNQEEELIIYSDCNARFQVQGNGVIQNLTDESGFLHTGDIGTLDDSGRVYLSGRKSNFFKVNGYKVSGAEIERVLKNINGIQEAAVIGIPDNISGNSIIAFVEPFIENRMNDLSELEKVCREKLSPYKVPNKIVLMKIIPRTKSGKPDYLKIAKEQVE